MQKRKTSWEPVQHWYKKIVGEEGHYYHQNVILPKLIPLLELKSESKLLDLACGSGILGRSIPAVQSYHGVDISTSLIQEAKKLNTRSHYTYQVHDITQTLKLPTQDFSHATIILAIQNIEAPLKAFENARKGLNARGKLAIVMNHPCFRIPRQSSWEIDEQKKLQYRRIDRYMSALAIPIQAHPSQKTQSAQTFSFHHPLSAYINWLQEAGFTVESMHEWCSDKESTGKNGKMENRARDEIPLFLTIIARVK